MPLQAYAETALCCCLFTDSIFKTILKGIKAPLRCIFGIQFAGLTMDVKTSHVTETLNVTPVAHTNDK